MVKFAFVFPGQGSQTIGMMSGFGPHPVVRETFTEASAVLGTDLFALAENGPPAALNLTTNTQPLMLAAGLAAYRAWRASGGPPPEIVAGHSLGEYTALVAAEALTFRDALPLVHYRAQAMQDAVPPGVGAMAAIMGAEDSAVAEACAEARQGQVVAPVNFNAPGQVVIAGHKEAVERAMVAAKQKGAKRAVLLPVSAPFHSSLLQPAASKLAVRLAQVAVQPPKIRVVHNVDVAEHTHPDEVRTALAQQAAHPVRWSETVRLLAANDIRHIVECGPGRVLAGLTRRIDENLHAYALIDSDAIEETLAALSAA